MSARARVCVCAYARTCELALSIGAQPPGVGGSKTVVCGHSERSHVSIYSDLKIRSTLEMKIVDWTFEFQIYEKRFQLYKKGKY